jgi:hypothetical protein
MMPNPTDSHNAIINQLSAAIQAVRAGKPYRAEDVLSTARAHINTQRVDIIALERIASAASDLRTIQKCRARDEQEHAAAGRTFSISHLVRAESELDEALKALKREAQSHA